MGRCTSSRILCWGSNEWGQLGNPLVVTLSPQPISPSTDEFFKQVSAGDGYTCAVTTDDRVFCWGSNGAGALGDGTTIDRGVPRQSEFPLSNELPVRSPVAGGELERSPPSTCVTDRRDTVWCFNQHATGGHRVDGGINQADDSKAWDVNLGSGDDEGKAVFAAHPGVVSEDGRWVCNANRPCVSRWGQVLIEHRTNGKPWWTGYLHLRDIQVKPGDSVTANTVLGCLSDVSPDALDGPHLHFAVYKTGEAPKLESIDAEITSRLDNPSPHPCR